MSLPPERRRHLQGLGLRALVKRRFGAEVASSARISPHAGAVMLIAREPDGEPFAAVFADSPLGLAAAVDAAHREAVAHLYFFAEANTPAVARRAAQFRLPVNVVAPGADFVTLDPDPPEAPRPLPDRLLAVETRFRAAGLDPVWEHGVLTGEWLGLEVARAVDGPEAQFEVGVGKHDREGNALLYPDGPTDALLAHAVSTVAGLRRPAAGPHPANQLVPERWLRAVLVSRPSLVDLSGLVPVPPPEARSDLRQSGIAPAWGYDAAGQPVAVVCSVGVDPDVVPQGADALVHAPLWPGAPALGWRLVIAVPEGDDHPLTRRVASALRQPAEVVTVPSDWRALGG